METKKQLLEKIRKLELQITQLEDLVDMLNEDFNSLYEDYETIIHKYNSLVDKVNNYYAIAQRYNPMGNYTNVFIQYSYKGNKALNRNFVEYLNIVSLLGEEYEEEN